ncbi:MAG: hypothetical protein AABY22_27430 [Nanoarchaeota archaeon]
MGEKHNIAHIPYSTQLLILIRDGNFHEFETIKHQSLIPNGAWNSVYVSLRSAGYIEKKILTI